MKKEYFLIIVFFVLLISPKIQQAQNGMLLYNMESIPQRNEINPAFFPERGWYITLLGFNLSLYTPVNPFPYVEKSFGKRHLDATEFLNSLGDNNKINVSPNVYLLGFGIRKNKWFATFSMSVRSATYINIEKGLFNVLVNGNENYLGKETMLLSKGFVESLTWNEISFGGGYKINDQLTVGGHLKFLTGYLNISSRDSYFSLYTSNNIDLIKINYNFDFKVSSLLRFDSLDIGSGNMTSVFPGNHGFGLDLGVDYKFNEKLQFSASILDLGFITWNENVKNIKGINNSGEFIFTGLDWTDMWVDGKFNEDYFSSLGDTLKSVLNYEDIQNASSYKTSLPVKFYLSGSYLIMPSLKANVLYRGEFFNNTYHSATSINATYSVNNWFEVTAGNSFIGTSWFNPGVGGSITMGNTFQLYLILDCMSSFYVTNLNAFNLHYGMSLLFGKTTQKALKNIPNNQIELQKATQTEG